MNSYDKDKRIRERELEEENIRLKKELEKTKKEFKAKYKVTVENLRRAMKIKPNSKKKPKPLGAPRGHKAYTRHIPERIDSIKALNPKRCPTCKTKLKKEPIEIRARYVTDIRLVSKAEATRYDIYRKYCPTCDKFVQICN